MATTAQSPFSEMNTTPLIDVLLVLLVMFIITIPVATHSTDIDLPQCGPGCVVPQPDPVRNVVTIDDADTMFWNGRPVTSAELAYALKQTRTLPVEPELQFEPDARASYAASLATLSLIEASGVTKFGFVGNQKYRSFGR